MGINCQACKDESDDIEQIETDKKIKISRRFLQDVQKEIVSKPKEIIYKKYTFPNGSIYKGEWNGENRHGFGTQNWTDGAKYSGSWRNNKANGQGTFWHANGEVLPW